MSTTTNETVAVVGGGAGGLLTAVLLARRGLRVTVFEGASQLGGRARSPALGPAAANLGPHALYRQGPAERLLQELDVPLNGWSPRPADTWLWVREQLVRAPVTPGGLLGAQPLPRAARWRFIRTMLGLHRRATGPDTSLAEWLAETKDPDARALLAAFTRLATYSHAPAHTSAAVALTQLAASLAGVTYLDGGWAALVSALHTQLTALGARVELSTSVAAVSDGGQRVTTARGVEHRVSATVLATTLDRAAQLAPALAPVAQRALPTRVATLDLVLATLPVPGRTFTLGIDAPLYWSVHSRPGQRPVLAHAMYSLEPGERGADGRARLEAWLDVLQPGWRSQLLANRFLPELCVLEATPGPGWEPVPRRLAPRLFATGEWTTRRVLLDGVAESARSVAEELMAALNLEPGHTAAAA